MLKSIILVRHDISSFIFDYMVKEQGFQERFDDYKMRLSAQEEDWNNAS